jgi:hypothetical protein
VERPAAVGIDQNRTKLSNSLGRKKLLDHGEPALGKSTGNGFTAGRQQRLT